MSEFGTRFTMGLTAGALVLVGVGISPSFLGGVLLLSGWVLATVLVHRIWWE